MKVYIKIDKKLITFSDAEIENHQFHQHKRPILISTTDINKILVSNKVFFGVKGFKYFIGYKDRKEKRPSCT